MATEPASRTLMTADELLTLPGDARRELIQGELREMNPAGSDHGEVAIVIGALVLQYARERGGRAFAAETGFKLSSRPDTVRAPDVAYLRPARAAAGRSPGYRQGAPDLAVEVLSPTDTYADTHEKALEWLEHGAAVVLVADPVSRHVTRYRSATDIVLFSGGQHVDCAPAMPGFTPAADELVPEL